MFSKEFSLVRMKKPLLRAMIFSIGTGTGVHASVGPEKWTSIRYSAESNHNAQFYGVDFIDADTLVVSGTEQLNSGNPGLALRYQSADGGLLDEWIKYVASGSNSKFSRQFRAADGSLLFVGEEGSRKAVWKYKPDGTLATGWPQYLTSPHRGYDVTQDSAGNVYVVGEVYNSGNTETNDWVIYKYAADGTLATGFPKVLDFNGYRDVAYRVAVDSEDNYIVAGLQGFATGVDQTQWVVRKYQKTDDSMSWEKVIGAKDVNQWPRQILVDAEDNLIISGNMENGTDSDAYFVKLAKADGSILWETAWDSGTEELGDSIAFAGNGDFYAANRVYNRHDKWRFHVQLRSAADGALLKTQEINHPTTQLASPTTENNGAANLAVRGNQLAISSFTDDQSGPSAYDYTAFTTMLDLMPDVGAIKWEAVYNYDKGNYFLGAFQDVDFTDADTLLVSGYGPALAVRYGVATGNVLDTPPEWLLDQDGGTYFMSQALDSNGDIYLAGRHATNRPGAWKYNSSGAVQWKASYSSAGVDYNSGIALTADEVISVGRRGDDWYISKRKKADGSMLAGFPIIYDKDGLKDHALGVAVDSKGDFIVVGYVTIDAATDHKDWHVRKYSSDGALLWQTTYDHKGLDDAAYTVVVDSKDDIIVSGYINKGADNDPNSDRDWYVVKYAADGDGNGGASIVWSRSWDDGHKRDGLAVSSLLDDRGNVYVGGSQENSTGASRAYIQYLDGNTGEMLKFKRLPHPKTVRSQNGTAGVEKDYLMGLALKGDKLAAVGQVWEAYVDYGRTGFVYMMDLDYRVQVNVVGEGAVSSAGIPEGIDMLNCASDCMASYGAGAQVTISAQGTNPDWTLARWVWAGDCTGEGGDCVLTMDSDKSVDVSFSCGLLDLAQPAAPIDSALPAIECHDIKAVNGYEIVTNGEVFFKAGNSISLGSGFNVNGGVFHAVIQ